MLFITYVIFGLCCTHLLQSLAVWCHSFKLIVFSTSSVHTVVTLVTGSTLINTHIHISAKLVGTGLPDYCHKKFAKLEKYNSCKIIILAVVLCEYI